ncbi:MAG: hypothetical protein KY396_01465, partial [Actinobacteria bacterium]|nr:hypothetical protein [Actinomycetota bacterium]
MEHGQTDPLSARLVLLTGAAGQLATALAETFSAADARSHGDLDVTRPLDLGYRPALDLHTAAWTNDDLSESDPHGA